MAVVFATARLMRRQLLAPINLLLRRMSMGVVDSRKLYDPSSIDEETKTVTANFLTLMENVTPSCEMTAQAARERRRKQYLADHAAHFGSETHQPSQRVDRTVSHPSCSVPVGVSVFRPSSNSDDLRGVYLHIHGGGWYMGGAAWQNDIRLCKLADRLRIAIVSVDYRLTPEATFPAPVDDCVAAAAWLAENVEAEFGTRALVIGGESAGGHLCAAALLRLRSALGLPSDAPLPYRAANLVYGIYDLDGTPSCRAYGERRLVFNYDEFVWCAAMFLGSSPPPDRRSPDVSPLYADVSQLRGLPPALFSVGTDDALLDDSLFMSARYTSAGNEAELAVYPGGAHGVGHFGPHQHTALGRKCHERIEAFLEGYLD